MAVSSATGNTNAATTAALAASTRRRVGVAVKVDRIIPVEYSAVTDRTASDPSNTAPTKKNPPNEQAVGSNVCALLGGHGGPLAGLGDTQDDAQDRWRRSTAMTAVRHVEGSVRSLVHSALSVLLIVRRSHRRSGVSESGVRWCGRNAHVRFLWLSRPAGRRGSRFRLWSSRNTPPRGTTREGPARRG